MSLLSFCICLLLLLCTVLIDLRTYRLLRRETHTRATTAILAFLPLQLVIQLVALSVVASTPIRSTRPMPVRTVFGVVPRPLLPSWPPAALETAKPPFERL